VYMVFTCLSQWSANELISENQNEFQISETISGFSGSFGYRLNFDFVYTEIKTFGNALRGFITHV
jgi:hypothetical protein